jgi:hypothetical protein
VQSGDYSVANVQQTAGLNDYGALIAALKAAQTEFADARISPDIREEACEHIQIVIGEIQKEKPNRLTLKSLLSGVATTVQALGSSSEAYKAVLAALSVLGVS